MRNDNSNGPGIITNKKAWQQSGGLTGGNTDKSVSLQADFTQAPGYYTVQFALSNYPAGEAPKATAEIVWAVEGASVRRKISIGQGTSISGTGQAVKVIVKDADSDPFDYVVQIAVTPGSRPATGQPPMLVYDGYQTAAPNAQVTFPIEDNVGAISAEVTIAPTNTLGVLPATAFVIIGDKSYVVSTDNMPQFTAIPPGSTDVRVINIGPEAITVNVSFGIDG